MNLDLHGLEPHIKLGDSSDDLPNPQDLAGEAITELGAIFGELGDIVALIEQDEGVAV